jgi:hypothetical protein
MARSFVRDQEGGFTGGGKEDSPVLPVWVTFGEHTQVISRKRRSGSHAGVIRLRVWPTTIEQTERRRVGFWNP